MMEEKISFAVLNKTNFRSEKIDLLEYDTVEILKIQIHDMFGIPPHKQIIEGWFNQPEDDQTILQFCSNVNRINYITVYELIICENYYESSGDGEDSLELKAARNCFKQICNNISTSHIKFNIVSLKQAIDQALLVPAEQRKVILLYMHNPDEIFSHAFLKMLALNDNISEILINSFFFVGWDVQNELYHDSLCEALKNAGMDHLCSFVLTKMSAVLIIQSVRTQIKILGVLTENTTVDELLHHLNNSKDLLLHDKQVPENETDEPDGINSTVFQKIMADRLGDRDYDCFAFDQHDQLKDKIGYALLGPPQVETGYNEKEKNKINKIYETICKHNNKISEYKDQVEMCCIFNCTEPLPDEKESRKKKYPDYNPATDILPVSLFILRKCRDSANPCRIFIDDIGRKYENWSDYLENNKLHKCIMVLPKNGRYKVENHNVLLERYESPACSLATMFVRAGDVASTVGGVGSGGVMLAAGAATVTSIAVAPVVLVSAAAVGAVAGVYSIGRSIAGLVDRVKHDEDLTLTNSEARAIYFNLLAGTLGFVGAGANIAVSQLVTRGVNIGQGVGFAVNSIGIANIGVSGASILNSGYDVFDQWFNENQTPSLLTIVQLSSSVLFFGNAVYNFRTCQTIVEETQARVLQDYSESLRSNRHRRTFNKLTKETIRQNEGNQARGRAEVIKTIRNIPNKDDVFAVLTRNNKMMNEKGIKFSALGGEITLNGQTINMNEFVVMNKQEANAFLSDLPTKSNISVAETISTISDFSLNSWSLSNVDEFASYALKLISAFGPNIRGMIFHIIHDLMQSILRKFKNLLKEIFPEELFESKLLDILMEYFGGKAVEILKKFDKWRQTGNHHYYDNSFSEFPPKKLDRYIFIFTKLIQLCFNGGDLMELELKEIISYAEKYILNEYYEYNRNKEADKARDKHSPQRPQKIHCPICSGYYFEYK